MRPLMLAHAALVAPRSMCTQPAAAIAQLGERQTEDLKVPGSIPGRGMNLFFDFLFYFQSFLDTAKIQLSLEKFSPLWMLQLPESF